MISSGDAVYIINRIGNDPTVGDNGPADVDGNGVINEDDARDVIGQISQSTP
ncbi:MAG: dockerin type I domain-containing protein [Chloroflexota bacterium]